VILRHVCGTCNHVNCAKHRADMGKLSQVACYFSSSRMFGADGKDGVIPTLGGGWCNPNLGTREGFRRM
jgi:hypothetical protein